VSAHSGEFRGTFCLVLHSHLPWLAHHGAWPVGEEWLYQSWAQSYLPVMDMLHRFAEEGRRDVLTLGVTPVLATQLDDPYCLRGLHDWLGNASIRAQYAATRWRGAEPLLRDLATTEFRAAEAALGRFETRWRHGLSPVLRPLVDSGVIELLGGPATHAFAPLLNDRVRDFALRTGLAETALRVGSAPEGLWAPECGYAPGMEEGYAAAGVGRFVVDGPALRGDTAAARPVGDSGVLCFGRDLEVTYRVWSPKAGYPGDPAYRDFHTFDHPSGLKPARVTGKHVAPEAKQPYDPRRAREALDRHVADFVRTVVTRLDALREARGDPGLVVCAYDTELFGHHWHEGPAWLEAVLRALPAAGVRVTTLRGAAAAGHVATPTVPLASSWGSGKDWRVWADGPAADLAAAGEQVQRQLLDTVRPSPDRDPVRDQLAREALLGLASDWAFMVSKDSAADYARRRADEHRERVDELAAAVRSRDPAARGIAERHRAVDGPFGNLDARGLAARR
jgi:1,4-alpha-glucan branching enzyme